MGNTRNTVPPIDAAPRTLHDPELMKNEASQVAIAVDTQNNMQNDACGQLCQTICRTAMPQDWLHTTETGIVASDVPGGNASTAQGSSRLQCVTKVWVTKPPSDKTTGRQNCEKNFAAEGRPAKTTYLFFEAKNPAPKKIQVKLKARILARPFAGQKLCVQPGQAVRYWLGRETKVPPDKSPGRQNTGKDFRKFCQN
jgi:hypothetical protein